MEEVFGENLAPNISTASISTQSNKSYEPLDFSEDLLIDDFFSSNHAFRPLEAVFGSQLTKH